jgi:hypothetical protein
MKNRFMQIIVGTFLGLLMLFGGTQLVSAQDGEGQSQSIEGTWRTIVTPVNCQTGVPVAPAFRGLSSFHKGGTVSGTSTPIAVAPSNGPFFGVWQRGQGFHDYSYAFTNFRFDTSGVFIGTQTVRLTVALGASNNEFTATATGELFDTNGNLIATRCSTVAGTRFE